MTPRGIDIDSRGSIVTTGFFKGDFDFDPGPAVYSVSNYTNGIGEAYLLKLNSSGDFTWMKKIRSPQGSEGNDLAVDVNDNICMIGDFDKNSDFDPGDREYKIIDAGDYFCGLMKLDAGGNFVYAVPFIGGVSLLRRMVVDDAQNIYITGAVAGTTDFDPGPNIYPVFGTSDESPFVLKLSRCLNPTTTELHINACGSYTLNNEIFDTSGVYKQIIPNGYGCDSVITLYLTINKQFKQQNVSICEGESFYAGSALQTTEGTYRDTLHTTTGCDSIVETQLTVHSKPLPELGTDKNLCSNRELTIKPGNFISYLWQDMSTEKSFTVSAAGKYWVKVTNKFNCTATDTITIMSVVPFPENFLKTTDSVCDYESLTVTPGADFPGYKWSTGATSKNISVQQPGIYWLTVTDANKCTGTDTISVTSKNCINGVHIPSAFTPNNDGKNDVFKPVVFDRLEKYDFSIFNRFGQLVFYSATANKGWDGKVKGIIQPEGVFVWVCIFKKEGKGIVRKTGTVALIH